MPGTYSIQEWFAWMALLNTSVWRVLIQGSPLFSLRRLPNSATSQQVKSLLHRDYEEGMCHRHACIYIHIYKILYVNVHVYVYTCVWIRIIQASKPLWRWSCLSPGQTAQPDCSGPCPVKCQALPDVKKSSWYGIGIFFPAPRDCCLCPTTMHLWGQSDTHMSENIWAQTQPYKHTHKVSFVLPLCIWERTSKWSLALAQCSYSYFW